jgi:hypothetical protein
VIVIFGKKWSIALCVFILLVAVAKPFTAWVRHHHMGEEQWFDTLFLAAIGVVLLVKQLQRSD